MTTEFASEKQLGKESQDIFLERVPFASLSGDPTVRGFRVFVGIKSTVHFHCTERAQNSGGPGTGNRYKVKFCTLYKDGPEPVQHSRQRVIESPSEQTSPGGH